MPVETTCPKGHPLRVAEEHFGLKVRCPTCGDVFTVQPKQRQPTFADSPPPAASPAPEPPDFPAPAPIDAGEPSRRPLREFDIVHAAKAWGQPLLLVGLLLVASAKGCDRIGAAGAQRAKAQVAVARAEWEREWDDRIVGIERELTELTSADRTEPLTESQRKRRDDLQRELNETLPKQKREEESELKSGAWRDLDYAASLADQRDAMSGYWREWFFFGGTLFLLAGLVIVGFNSQGPERWACLLLLAVIALTFYGLNVGAAVTSR